LLRRPRPCHGCKTSEDAHISVPTAPSPIAADPATLAVWVRDLHKRYGEVEAVSGLNLQIRRGQIVALLGPNGAGKTTTMEIIEGLRSYDSGEVRVLGLSPLRARRRVGVQLQESALYEDLTCAETIRLFGRLYGFETDPARLLRLVDLEDMMGCKATALSGGQKRRLQIALTLCNDPELVVLDEPTTGLDPLSRRQTWAMIEQLHRQGRTVLLTTHYIEEAAQLAEFVVIIDRGQVVAEGTPNQLVADLGAAAKISVAASAEPDLSKLPGVIRGRWSEGRWELQSREVGSILAALSQALGEEALRDVAVHPPTLEDVFLEKAGRRLGEVDQ
jgi:ABC-2 type transport system ATP-binding protein